jgi:hypothetical protein
MLCIATTLRDLSGERVTEVLLSALESHFLEEFRPFMIYPQNPWMFVATLQLSYHPKTVSQ